jgi:hypothetical protein
VTRYRLVVQRYTAIVERDYEFLTDLPTTHAQLCCFGPSGVVTAILRVREGIKIRDLLECFGRMSPWGQEYRQEAMQLVAVAVRWEENDESNRIVRVAIPSAQDDPSESGDESDADDPDESDSGAEGAGLPDSSEPNDSDSDEDDDSENGDSEDDESGGSSGSDGGSEVGDSRSGEDDQVED